MKAIRNSLVLCCTLGLGFVIGFFPARIGSDVQGIVFTMVNGLAGFFIFVTSVFGNKEKREGFVRCMVLLVKSFRQLTFSKGIKRNKDQ